jgi:uncharacterized protein YndB with AHSA1/START domain
MTNPFSIDRDVVICATRATVFRYFTDPERWALWWGKGSRIDPRPGGEVFIQYPNGQSAQGNVVEIDAPNRFVFTFGYDRPDTPIPPGGSTVTITVSETAGGTRVQLRHDVATEPVRVEHVAGWRYQMAVFAAVVAAEHDKDLVATVDQYFAAWALTEAAARRTALAATCADDVVYRDRFGFSMGRDDLDGHIAAAQRHLPATLARDGDPQVALGMAVVQWRAAGADGAVAARGTSVVELAPDGRIARVTGFWV